MTVFEPLAIGPPSSSNAALVPVGSNEMSPPVCPSKHSRAAFRSEIALASFVGLFSRLFPPTDDSGGAEQRGAGRYT
jgi:hypothetical protein